MFYLCELLCRIMILRKICQNTISSAEIREEEKETFMNVIGETA